MKASYPTCSVTYGGVIYQVHLRVFPGRKPARVGPDSPRYLDPGASPRARVIRILRDGFVVADQVTHELLPSTRRAIEEAAISLAASRGGSCVGVAEVKSPSATPSYQDAENLR